MARGAVIKRPDEPSPQRRGYTLDEKLTALALLDRYEGNLTKTSKETGIHFNTLRKWRDETSTQKLQAQQLQEKDLSGRLELELYGIMDALPLARGTASYSQLASGFTAIFDRWSKLNGLPQEVTELIPLLVTAAKGANLDLVTYLKASLNKFNQVAEENLRKEFSAETPTQALELEDGETVQGEYVEVESSSFSEFPEGE